MASRFAAGGWRAVGLVLLGALACSGCEDLQVRDVASLFVPTLMRSEIVG